MDEAAAWIERLVNINSGTMNHKGVRDVGDILRAELDALGFDTDWSDMSALSPFDQRATVLGPHVAGRRRSL